MSEPIPVVPVIPVVPTPTPSPTPLPPKKVDLPAWVPASVLSLIVGGVIGAVICMNLPQNAPAPIVPDISLPETITLDPTGAPVKLQASLKNPKDTVTWLIPKWVRNSPKYKNFEYPDHELLSGTGGDYDIFGVLVVKGKPVVAETHVIGTTVTPPTPTPTPTPIPTPTPVPTPDPLGMTFQAAYALDKDTDRSASLSFLQSIYPAMADGFPNPPPASNTALLSWMKSKVQAPGVGLTQNQLVNLRTAIQTELTTAFGTVSTTPVDATVATAEIRKIANALSTVKH